MTTYRIILLSGKELVVMAPGTMDVIGRYTDFVKQHADGQLKNTSNQVICDPQGKSILMIRLDQIAAIERIP